MKNLSLAKKTFIGYGVAIIILIAFSIMAINAQRTIADKYNKVYDTYTVKCIDIGNFTKNYKELESLLSDYSYAADDGIDLTALSEQIAEVSDTCSKQLDELISSVPTADKNGQAQKSLENVQQTLENGTTAFKQIVTLVSQKKYAQAMNIYQKSIKAVSDDVDEEVSNVSKYFNDKSEAGRKSVERRNERSSVTLGIITVACMIFFLAIAATYTRYITRPINALTERAERISKGDISGEKINATTNDELGKMINSFNEVVERMKREVKVANNVANGDLSMQINPQSQADELGHAFKLMVDSNNKTLGNIKESAYQVGAGAQQVAIASQSLAQGSTEQASAIEQVTSSISEVTSRTKQNADEAKEAETLVNQAKEEAIAGTDEMNKMMSAMQDITEASENISKITNGKYNNILFNDEQGLIVELPNGNYVSADRLSIGTIDQIYLSLRLASIDEISNEKLPIILDEAFAYFDDIRLENIMLFLSKEFKDRQIIIFTCTTRELRILQNNNIEFNFIEL